MAALLLTSILLPLAGAFGIGLFLPSSKSLARATALAVSLLTLLCVCVVAGGFAAPAALYPIDVAKRAAERSEGAGTEVETDTDTDTEHTNAGATSDYAVTEIAWLPASMNVDLKFAIGLDGLGLWMYGLSAVLMITAVLVSWEAINERPNLFYAMLLLLESGCLGVFAARDVLLFYICFEFTLIPLFFLIGIWGSEDRRYAATKFFVFTLAGSLLTFVGILAIVLHVSQQLEPQTLSFSVATITRTLAQSPISNEYQKWIFVALFAGFAIKVPLFPLHTWLPLAHVQAPTAGSVFLAGILLKIGTYGFLRFSIPMLPFATQFWSPVLMWLAVIGIIYGAMVALAQTDMKRLVAYSSVSHLGFCVLGLFALNVIAVQGATLQMVNHGISTGALFALIGMIYERYHTREISDLGGLAKRLPIAACFMMLFTFSSIGLPGLNGFVGEIMILLGTFQQTWSSENGVDFGQRVVAVLAVSGVVLGAWYMLWFMKNVFFGPLKEPMTADHEVHDLGPREILALVPLVILVFWIGLYPKFFLDRMGPALNETMQPVARLQESQSKEAYAEIETPAELAKR